MFEDLQLLRFAIANYEEQYLDFFNDLQTTGTFYLTGQIQGPAIVGWGLKFKNAYA